MTDSHLVFFLAHNAVVTSAIFAPNPSLMVSAETSEKQEPENKSSDLEAGDTIPSGGYQLAKFLTDSFSKMGALFKAVCSSW